MCSSDLLVSRLIDRPIRPCFVDGFYHETQIICTVLSHDTENNPDIIAVIGASAALAISGIPFTEPVAASKVGLIDGEFVLNPTPEQLLLSDLDLVVAGTKSSVLMVESEAQNLTEETMLAAVQFGHDAFQPVIELIEQLKSEAGKPVWQVVAKDFSTLKAQIIKLGETKLRNAYKITDKQKRVTAIEEAKKHILEKLAEKLGEEFNGLSANGQIKDLEKDIVRNDILETGKRIDGRGTSDIRQIVPEVSVLPKTHGSSLFTRGETQALVVTTLGTSQDMQIIDSLEGEYKQRFMLHYNFPPFSVGEASQLKSPGRREIGHGKLAWRALKPALPSLEEFPYTIRVVSEITESNGSSSMATVCGGSLAMMDAGVPMKAPVAGIAMGLIKEGDKFSVLSDILGDEDHLGDMDFKVAGTQNGVTALQMDIKINGITFEIMRIALEQAKEGRVHIIGKMSEVLNNCRETISQNAPQIATIKIDKEKIGALIGPGGKMIREICEVSGAKIDIDEDGTVKVSAVGSDAIEKALAMVSEVVLEAEPGKIYEGAVVKILDFGVLVNFLGKFEGLVHISEIKDERIENIEDVIKLNDKVKVKVLSVDRGKVRLSIRRVDQETGEDISSPDDVDTYDSSQKRSGSRDRDRGRGGHSKAGGRNGRGGDRGDRNDSRDRGERNEGRDNRDRDSRGGRNDRDRNSEGGRARSSTRPSEDFGSAGSNNDDQSEGRTKKRFF